MAIPMSTALHSSAVPDAVRPQMAAVIQASGSFLKLRSIRTTRGIEN